MINTGEGVRALFMKLSREQKNFFGGPPFTQEINRELANYQTYKKEGVSRQRTCIGTIAQDNKGDIIGYQSATILQSANPTRYEQTTLGLTQPITCVHAKKILVDPNYFGKGIANELLNTSIVLAKQHATYWVTDVRADNKQVIRFLEKNNITQYISWRTPKNTHMYRLTINPNHNPLPSPL